MDQQKITKKVWSIAKKVLIALIIAVVVIIVLLIVVFAYFNSSTTRQVAQPSYSGSESLGLAETGIAPAVPPTLNIGEQKTTASDLLTTPSTPGTIQPKIIKTDNLSIIVEDVDKAVGQITNEAVLVNGFVQNSSVTENEKGQKYADIILRVPAANFEKVISEIKSLAKLVEREDVNGQEVTQEYVDLQANLTHNQAVEAQYLELLKRAQKVEEIIAVRDKLDQVQGEIESLKGRLRYLDNQTEMSTIAVSITSEAKVTLPAEKWQPWEVIKEAVKNLIVGLQNFVNFIIVFIFSLIGLIPYLLVIFLIYLLIRWIYKRNKK